MMSGFLGGGLTIGSVIFVVVISAIAPFIGAAITHLCLLVCAGKKTSYETTLRVLSYSGGASALFLVIPVLGSIVSGVFTIYANIVGLARTHQISGVRAAVAVLLPVILACGCAAVFMGLFVAALAPSNASGSPIPLPSSY
jgi:hypothetical protein